MIMEKKTMGSFIAALRRANGMTQRELAERLNVSDKSVSRWECDDGYPDLSLIPVIAEIFGVTADELLRGERKASIEGSSNVGEFRMENELGRKGQKELDHMKRMAMNNFRSMSFISIGVSFMGIVAAAICNLAFNKASLGFFVGCVFFVSSVVFESIALNSFLSMNAVDEHDGSLRRAMTGVSEVAFFVTAVLFSFTLPLVLLVPSSHLGLSGSSWLKSGCLFMLAAGALLAIVIHVVNGSLVSRGIIALEGEVKEKYQRKHKLQTIIGGFLLAALAVTFIANEALTSMWGPLSVMTGTVFNDYESFLDFVETDTPAVPFSSQQPGSANQVASGNEESIYYDENGNVVSKDEALTMTIQDRNGNTILKYVQRNGNVLSVSYSIGSKDGNALPITVYTHDDYKEGKRIVSQRNAVFACVYALEVAAAVIAYAILRRKCK